MQRKQDVAKQPELIKYALDDECNSYAENEIDNTIHTSTGILIEANYENESNISCSLFLSMKKLRNIAIENGYSSLSASLHNIDSRDKKAGLYSAISENINSSDENDLANLILSCTEIIFDQQRNEAYIIVLCKKK